ncbi:MAG: LuxR C-terminal-related transcriptional regulator, partial [Pseudomonadales bacterium]|nr:LuxR C-terminal-related transcriptional regulator [Pseudomonadales bacterium]
KAAETISHGLNRKDQAELIEPLSARELEVLFLINDGLANKQIAAKLSLAPATVKAHIRNLYGKMAVKSRTEALAKARQLALLEQN